MLYLKQTTFLPKNRTLTKTDFSKKNNNTVKIFGTHKKVFTGKLPNCFGSFTSNNIPSLRIVKRHET